MSKWFGLMLVRLGRAMQETGQEGIRQREWYEYKSFASKIIVFLFDTAGMLLLYGLTCWLVGRMGSPIKSKLFFILYVFVWYANPVIKRWFRRKRHGKKQSVVGA